jgi:hypothetical protein
VTIGSWRPRWRTVVDRHSAHAAQPFILGGLLLGAIALASPFGFAAVAAVAVALAGYLAWPKPALLVVALFALFSRLLVPWFTTDLARFDDIVVPVLLLIAVVRLRPLGRRYFNPLRDGALLGFFAVGALSSVAAAVPLPVWIEGIFSLVKVFAFLYLVSWHDFDQSDVRQLAPLVAAAAVVVLAVGLLEALDPVAVRTALNLGVLGEARETLPSIKSLLWHPGTFAFFTTFVALFLFAGYVVFRRWWLLVGGLVFGAATILGARRRALAALVAGLLAGFAASVGRSPAAARAPSIRAWAAVAAAIAILAVAFLPALLGLVRSSVDEAADPDTARVALYVASVDIARDHFPLGVGHGRFGSRVSRDPYSPVYAEYGLDRVRGLGPDDPRFAGDAFWPRVLGETGVLGAALFVLFLGMLTRDAWRAARSGHVHPLVRAFGLGAWMVMIQALVETLASPMFDAPTRVYLVLGAVGMALSMTRVAPE